MLVLARMSTDPGDTAAIAEAIRGGDRRALAQTITLLESTRPDRAERGEAILEALVPDTGSAVRLGITGPPGVGKSTFIEALGLYLVAAGHHLAVLALGVVSGAMIVHLFDAAVFDRWLASGKLLVADTLLVGIALLATAKPRPLVVAAYFVVVLLATLTSNRFKTLLGSLALLGVLAALALAGGVGLVWRDGIYLPLLTAAALHFGSLAERITLWSRQPKAGTRQADELWALMEITDTITGTLELSQVMHSIVDQVGNLLSTRSCSILLVDERSPDCFVVASKGHPEADMLELDLAKYPEVRQVMETKRPLIVDDIDAHPLIAPVRNQLQAQGYHSMLVMPLLVGRELVGVLLLKSQRFGAFDPSVVRFSHFDANNDD